MNAPLNAPLQPAFIPPGFHPWPTDNVQVAISTFQRIAIEAANGAAVLRQPSYMPRDPVGTGLDTRGLQVPSGPGSAVLSPSDFPDLPTAPAGMAPGVDGSGVDDFSALQTSLDVFKSYPNGKVGSNADRYRLLAAVAYSLGYLEGRGLINRPATLSLILDTSANRDASFGNSYAMLINGMEQLVEGGDTRRPANWREICHAVGGVLVGIGTALQAV